MKGLLSVLGPYTWELQITHYFSMLCVSMDIFCCICQKQAAV